MTSSIDKTREEAQIRAVIEDRTKALRAKNGLEVVRHHAPRFVLFSLAPPLATAPTDASGLEAWFATWEGLIGYEPGAFELAIGGDVAFCHGLVRMHGRKKDGEEPDLWFRRTLGLRKVAGPWKIAHEHQSVPFYMDGSDRAALDLVP
ncbi:MAG: nuclear transport factor 2 family protein [Rhodospirillales bacterium]|nr:nuclear transport factor 2 family protein [Rhodospirillales bacterium]